MNTLETLVSIVIVDTVKYLTLYSPLESAYHVNAMVMQVTATGRLESVGIVNISQLGIIVRFVKTATMVIQDLVDRMPVSRVPVL